MFSFFKRSKSRTPSNEEKLHNTTILDQDVTSCSKNTDQRLSNLSGNENKISFHENVNQFQNDTKRDRTFTIFNGHSNNGCDTKNTVEIPAVKKTSLFTEIMAKGRNRHRNKNKNSFYKNSNNNNNNKNDQQSATLNIDHNNSGINNNNNNNNDSGNSSNCISNNDTITKTRINDHIDHIKDHVDDHLHNRNDVGDDEKQNENFSSSNLFLNNKNDEYKNNLVEIEINNIISNNINFVKTTCPLPPTPTPTTTIPTVINTDIVSSSQNSATSIIINEEPATIEHNNDADFVKNLIINKFKMGQPSSKIVTTTEPENINNNNNSYNNNNNNSDNTDSNILDDQSDKEIFYEATDDHINIVLNEKPVLPDLNQLIDIQINECENIPNLDLICNNSDNLNVNNSESDEISSSDNNSENGNTIIESRILFDLRKELNEIKKHKVINSSVQNYNNNNDTDQIDQNDAFNNDNDDSNDSDKLSEKPKSIIKNKFDHSDKIKKRVTFLPDLVESTSIPPIHDHDDDHDNIIINDDNDDDDTSIDLSDRDDDVGEEIKLTDDDRRTEEEDEEDEEDDNEDHGKNDYHVEFETSSSEEDLEKDTNDFDDQNSLIIVEEINTSEDDCSIIEDNVIPRDLVNQESRFNEKLEKVESEKNAAQLKLEDLEIKIDILEKEHSIKSWNVERLQAELISAYTEGECVRKRLKQHEQELTDSRGRCAELEEEWSAKYNELQSKYDETQERLNEIKKFCGVLQIQLAEAKADLEKSQKEITELTERHENEHKLLEQAIEEAIHDKSESETKWKKEFEQLRSVNSEREEHLMEDCEWQLRNMQKICKDKVELAEKEKLETLQRAKEIELDAFDKYNQVEHFKSYEAEVNQLRGLTNGQRESIQTMNKQIEDLNAELQAATQRAEEEIENMKKMKWQCEMEIYDNQRYTTQKIEMETMAIACQWEQKLLEEMAQLTNELNQIHGEERQVAVEEARAEGLKQLDDMKKRYDEIDTKRKNEIESLTKALQNKQNDLESLQSQADTQLVQARMFLERADHEHQTAIDREMEKNEVMLTELREQHENDKQHLEEEFRERLQHVKDEFAVELTNTTTELTEKNKRNMQNQRQQLQKEKDEALQAMEQKYKHKLADLENRLKEQELSQQRIVEELKSAHKMERSILEQRDHQNNKEIETLHRKCRCLTNLFEEMRMRYERRDPRGEDLREIEELKNRCDQQETDLRSLTERLREYQLLNDQTGGGGRGKNSKNQPRKNSQPNIKVPSRSNIDVIYEEVEPEIAANGPIPSRINNNNNINAIEQTVENNLAEQ